MTFNEAKTQLRSKKGTVTDSALNPLPSQIAPSSGLTGVEYRDALLNKNASLLKMQEVEPSNKIETFDKVEFAEYFASILKSCLTDLLKALLPFS